MSRSKQNNDPSGSYIRLDGFFPAIHLTRILTKDIAFRYMAFPLWLEGETLVVAVADPDNYQSIQNLEEALRRSVRPLLASYDNIRNAIERVYLAPRQDTRILEFPIILNTLGISGISSLHAPLDIDEGNYPIDALAWYYNIPFIDLDNVSLQPGLSALITWEMARSASVIPLWWFQSGLFVGLTNPDNLGVVDSLSNELGFRIFPVLCDSDQWDLKFERLYLHGNLLEHISDKDIANSLYKRDLISNNDLKSVLIVHQQSGKPVKDVVLDLELVTINKWEQTRADLYNLPTANLSDFSPIDLIDLIPPFVSKACGVLPLRLEGKDKIQIGIGDYKPDLAELLENVVGKDVELFLVDPFSIKEYQNSFYINEDQRSSIDIGPALDELLLKAGLISNNQLNTLIKMGGSTGRRIGDRLINLGYLDEQSLMEMVCIQTGIPNINLNHVRIKEQLFSLASRKALQKYQMIPLIDIDDELWVAMADPFGYEGISVVEKITNKKIRPLLALKSAIGALTERYCGIQIKKVDTHTYELINKLIGKGMLTHEEANNALISFTSDDVPLDIAIANVCMKSDQEVSKAFAEIIGIPFMDLDLISERIKTIDPLGKEIERQIFLDPIDAVTARLITSETAIRLGALPIKSENNEVVVAFAVPNIRKPVNELEAMLAIKIRPVLTSRKNLENAIQRVLGRKNIGTYLLLRGDINRVQLNQALNLAEKTGVRLGKALINKGFVTTKQLYEVLAEQADLKLIDIDTLKLDEAVVRLIDSSIEREFGILPIDVIDGKVTVAMVDPLNNDARSIAYEKTGMEVVPVLVTDEDMESVLEMLYSEEYLARSTSELLERTPEESAYKVLSRGQKIFFAFLGLASVLLLITDFITFIILINTLATLFYLSFSAYKFYLAYNALAHELEISVSDDEVTNLDERWLPVYTILIPVYKEAHILPDVLNAVNNLDYPSTKLDIKVIMESDDLETIEVYNQLCMPSHFHGIIVPSAEPKTKPKACNYGLIHARGEYIVIFDAEDAPERDQLKKVVVAYRKASPEVRCIQAKLNYYNGRQNLLTRWFTIEYSMWFDLFLPGLDASRAPIPLGGTSNHFKKSALVEVGGWDPYNVTEDADLGMRLHKRGYRTATVDSTTYEEANSVLNNWIRQRSRWIKGYIQTWLVHMRRPRKLLNEIGPMAFLQFQLVVAGTFFAVLLNPIYWLMTSLWFLRGWEFIEIIYPGPVFLVGAVSLYLGNFAFVYMNVAGALRRKYYDLVKFALISPLYWGLMSLGAWKGLLQLITKPHFWEKTDHGLSKKLAPDTGGDENEVGDTRQEEQENKSKITSDAF